LPVFSSPVKATTDGYVFTQEWVQALRNFIPEPLGSNHPSGGYTPDYSDYMLVQEGPRQDIGGGMIKWHRTYAKVPASHDEFESYSYSFIGFEAYGWLEIQDHPSPRLAGQGRAGL